MNSRSSVRRMLAGVSAITVVVVGVGSVDRWSHLEKAPRQSAHDVSLAVVEPEAPAQKRPAVSRPVRKPPAGRPAVSARQRRLAALAHDAQRAAERQRQAQAAHRREVALAKASAPFSFNLASFNILGSNHSQPGSDADHFAPGRVRAEWATDVIRGRALDIVGFSEIQGDQLSAFMRTTGGAYDVWPGTALRGLGIPASVVWRKDRFTAVSRSSITIPFVGQRRPMPVVRLKERATGRQFYIINAHNSPNDRQRERNVAIGIEIGMIKKLRAEQRVPVFFFGDLNEKQTALCKVTGQTDLVAASPTGNLTGCSGFRGMRLDWLFGSNATFSGYAQDRSPLVTKITDHAVVVARATVG